MLKISYAGSLGLFSGISSQFTLKMCAAAKNCEKIYQHPFWEVQGGSRSVMFTNPKSPSPVLVIICSMSVFICNRFHAGRDNCGKIATFKRIAVFDARLRRPLWTYKGSGLGLLKSTFNAENSIRRLSWSIPNHLVAIQCWNVRCIQKLRKIH